MLRHLSAFAIAAFLVTNVSHAATELPINLATIDPGSELTLPIAPGDYTVVILNKVPTKVYNIQALVSFTTLPPLEVPSLRAGEMAALPDPCQELTNSTATIQAATDEDEIATAVEATQELLNKKECTTDRVVLAAKNAIKNTKFTLPDTFSVASGQELVVTVSRTEGTDQKRWKITYQTPARGRWFSSYGFAFVQNKDEEYFSKAKQGEDGKFIITRKADNKDYDFAPSLFFSWMPRQREGRDLNPGVTAGLGFDQSNPIVFLGPMLTYNQNISLIAGVVMHKQKRLNGIYSLKEPEITENLTSDQLQEETFKPSLFFGLSFRFGSNPFASSQSSETQPNTPTVTPTDTQQGANQ